MCTLHGNDSTVAVGDQSVAVADLDDAGRAASIHPTVARSPKVPSLHAMASATQSGTPSMVPRDPMPVSDTGAISEPDLALYSQDNESPSLGVAEHGKNRHVVHVGTWARGPSIQMGSFSVKPTPGKLESTDLSWAQPRWAADDVEPGQLREEGQGAGADLLHQLLLLGRAGLRAGPFLPSSTAA